MRDLNFFLPYQEKPKKTRYDKLILFSLFAILLVVMFLLELGIRSKIANVQDNILQKEIFVNSINTVNGIKRVDQKTSDLEYYKKILIELDAMESILNVKGSVHIGLFNEINDAVPENVYITSLNMTNANITISGYADSYDSVALFQHQLKVSDKFKEVSVPSISEDGMGNYSFSLNGVLNITADVLEENETVYENVDVKEDSESVSDN